MDEPDRDESGQAIGSDGQPVSHQIDILQRISSGGEGGDDQQCEFVLPRGAAQNEGDQHDRAADDPSVERQMPPAEIDGAERTGLSLFLARVATAKVGVVVASAFNRKVEDAS